MRIANETLFTAPAVSQDMVASFFLRPAWLGHICNYSIQLVFTGSPVGTFKLQGSDDPGSPNAGEGAQANGVTNWTDIAASSQAIAAAGNILWDVANCGYNFVRVAYTATSGTGTVTSARINVKGA